MKSSKLFLTTWAAAVLAVSPRGIAADAVPVNWLGGKTSPVASGVSWGVPWPKGTVQKDQKFALTGQTENRFPCRCGRWLTGRTVR